MLEKSTNLSDKMMLLTSKELLKAAKMNFPGGAIVANAMMELFRYNELNQVYSSIYNNDPEVFVDSVFEKLGIRFEIDEKDLDNIPADGPLITISNHPFGGIDSLILTKILLMRRPDFKIMGNFLLQRITPLKDHILPVNPFENMKEIRSSFPGLRSGISYLNNNHLLGIFPAGEVSTYRHETKIITDREWQISVLKFIHHSRVPVIPVYFHGSNSVWFHTLAMIHPALRTIKLPSELLNKKNKTIKLRIGRLISVSEQSGFKDINSYGQYLRARTYALGDSIGYRNSLHPVRKNLSGQVPVASPGSKERILKDVEFLKQNYLLFSYNDYTLFYSSAEAIPNLLPEIGRLREITFREIGEGTNQISDTDSFDLYYNHLILWDNRTGSIIGSYRIGNGKDIIARSGIKGFYINTLFNINPLFSDYLERSLELGRSFIVKEYQRKPLPLFLLWKGIFTVLIKDPFYRFMIGPVSISNNYSEFSRFLIHEFLKMNYFNSDLAKLVRSRNQFRVKAGRDVNRDILLKNTNGNIQKLESIIVDVERGMKLPVLLKKYLEINAEIIGFNVDPYFSNCLDCLMILDVSKLPSEYVNSLSLKNDPVPFSLKNERSEEEAIVA